MSAPERRKRIPIPASLFKGVASDPRREAAVRKIQGAVREFIVRRKARTMQLDTAGAAAYERLRVFHGTHDEHAKGISEQGLVAQGGEGLSGLIGDKSRSKGLVFYTRSRKRAAYYAATVTGIEQLKRVETAASRQDYDAIADIYDNPPKATIMRALLPRPAQARAKHDDKGGKKDFTLDMSVTPSLVLPGHLEPDAPVSQRKAAVTIFQMEMQKEGVQATREEAEATLHRRRRLSISMDQPLLDSTQTRDSAEKHLAMYKATRTRF